MAVIQNTYKPDLGEFITQCEVNYWLILRLMPFLNIKKNLTASNNNQQQNMKQHFQTKLGHQIDFELVDKAKFTTTIVVNLKVPNQLKMNLMARLYHDLELLEVMDKIGPKALKPINTGNELQGRQSDEKRQLNRFLGESLKHCLQNVGNAKHNK
jgi:uncharacterized protein YqiB (DUF1249 family)